MGLYWTNGNLILKKEFPKAQRKSDKRPTKLSEGPTLAPNTWFKRGPLKKRPKTPSTGNLNTGKPYILPKDIPQEST